jgi:hypothetical protein
MNVLWEQPLASGTTATISSSSNEPHGGQVSCKMM